MRNTMKNIATISERSERYEEWIKVFGTDQVPIINILVPQIANVLGEVRKVYMLDLGKLSEDQLIRLKEHLSRKFSIPMEEVERDLPEIGVPILAEDVSLSSDELFFL